MSYISFPSGLPFVAVCFWAEVTLPVPSLVWWEPVSEFRDTLNIFVKLVHICTEVALAVFSSVLLTSYDQRLGPGGYSLCEFLVWTPGGNFWWELLLGTPGGNSWCELLVGTPGGNSRCELLMGSSGGNWDPLDCNGGIHSLYSLDWDGSIYFPPPFSGLGFLDSLD